MHALALRFRLRDASPETVRSVGEALAAELASALDLVAVGWIAGDRPGRLTSVTTFDNRAACERFAHGPSIERLRDDPHVADIVVSSHPLAEAVRDRGHAASA